MPALPRAWEAALREIIYRTRCTNEGCETMCNVYGCKVHEHPEVKKIRRILLRLYGERNKP